MQATLGDVTLKSAQITAGGKVTLAALNGDVNLTANKDVDFRHEVKSETGGMWVTHSDKGNLDETVQHTTIDAGDGLTITVGTNGSINVDYKDFGDLDKSIERLSAEPGLEWMAQVKAGVDPVQWIAIQEAHKSWDYSSQSLSPAAAMIITMVATIATMGAGTLFTAAGSTMQGLSLGGMATAGSSLSPAMAAAVTAGINSLAISAAVSTVANKGNPLDVMKDLASKESLRNLAAAMVTAGLLQGVSAEIGIDMNATDLPGRIQAAVLRVTVNTVVQSTINGQDLGDTLKTSLIMAVSQVAMGEIHELTGSLDDPAKKALIDGLTGGAFAELMGGDFLNGAASAAVASLASGGLANSIEDDQVRAKTAALIGGLTSMMIGGDVEDMAAAASIADSIQTNAAGDPDFKQIVKVMKVVNPLMETGLVPDNIAPDKAKTIALLSSTALMDQNGNPLNETQALKAMTGLLNLPGAQDWLSGEVTFDSIEFEQMTQIDQYSSGLSVSENSNQIVPLLIAGWALIELGLSAYDIYEAGATVLDDNASGVDKTLAVGGVVIGMLLPGGGYGTASKLAYDKTKKVWTSKAGLEFGYDKNYGNRIKHVMAHFEPNPNKLNHSVFSFNKNEIIDVLDETWSKVKTNKSLYKVPDNAKDVYVVDLGRKIGTNGQTKIRIVVDPDTSKVTSAYPYSK